MGELRKRGDVWHADYVDRDGRRVRRSTKMRDKQKAAKVLAAWESGEHMVRAGIKARTREDEPIESVLQEYEASLAVAQDSDQHVDRTGQLVRAVASHCDWQTLGDISASGVSLYARTLKSRGQAARTIASMITAVRSLCRWCIRKGYLAADPTATVQKPSVQTDRRIERRMILPAEWKWIRAGLELVDVVRNGQSSKERLLMYRLAIETGLRSSELRSLIRSSLHLDGREPHVRVKAGLTKNAKMAKQYLSDALATDLASFVKQKRPSEAVFSVASRQEMARTIRNDVEDARTLWLASPEGDEESDFLTSPNSQGEVIDFHALRHTCGAWLVMQGVTLAEVREIMRHSTITLTVDHYGHLAPDARSRNRQVLGDILD